MSIGPSQAMGLHTNKSGGPRAKRDTGGEFWGGRQEIARRCCDCCLFKFCFFVWLFGWLVGYCNGCLFGWLVGLIVCLVSWLVGWLVVCLFACSSLYLRLFACLLGWLVCLFVYCRCYALNTIGFISKKVSKQWQKLTFWSSPESTLLICT